MERRVLGVKAGRVNTRTDEIVFDLAVEGKQFPMSFVASYEAFTQIMNGLGRLFVAVQNSLYEKKTMKGASAEAVASTHIQRDRWANVVLMQLSTPEGVPYTFAIPPQVAADMAEQLKTESSLPHQAGNA